MRIPTLHAAMQTWLEFELVKETYNKGTFILQEQTRLIALVATIGACIGLGKLLASDEKISFRLAFGRMITTAGLALSASAVLIAIPGLNETAMIGLAAGIASLGRDFLESLLKSYTGKKNG